MKNHFALRTEGLDNLGKRLAERGALRPSQTYCLFLDILGFKELLNNWKKARAAFCSAMRTMLVLPELHDILAEGFQGTSDRPLLGRTTVLALSDAVAITGTHLSEILWIAGSAAGKCLGERVALRGFITRGLHAELQLYPHRLVLSLALRDAYLGERDKAKFPRIVVDSSVLNALNLKDIADLPPLSQDEDGQWFVAPFTYVWHKHELSNAMRFVRESLKRFSSNHSVFPKYCWLADFLNALAFSNELPYHCDSDFRKTLRSRATRSSDWAFQPIPAWKYSTGPARRFILPLAHSANVLPARMREVPAGIRDDGWPIAFFPRGFDENWRLRCSLFQAAGPAAARMPRGKTERE